MQARANKHRRLVAFCAGLLLGSGAFAADEHRELGAHEHGHGTLNIAVEGNKLSMELEVPGVDIVGFEHAAASASDKAAVEKAKAQLASPLALFSLPGEAACRVTQAEVELEIGEHHHDADHQPKSPNTETHVDAHAEFHAEYALECANPSRLTAIQFGYFAAFPGAQRLTVSIITPKGQSQFEATRANTTLSLAGMM